VTNVRVTPSELRAGADKIDTEKTTVTGLSVPDPNTATAGLTGFATAAALSPAHDAVVSALKVAGGRFEVMGRLFRNTATDFEMADVVVPGVYQQPWMSQHVGDGLTAMGDMNLSRS
jgi:hypothetical protein